MINERKTNQDIDWPTDEKPVKSVMMLSQRKTIDGCSSPHQRSLEGGNDRRTWENPTFSFFTWLNNNHKERLDLKISHNN